MLNTHNRFDFLSPETAWHSGQNISSSPVSFPQRTQFGKFMDHPFEVSSLAA
jgi:hypothetical protein